MKAFSCFDVVTFVTDEATKIFATDYKEDWNAKLNLKKQCDAIDSIVERFGGTSLDVDVNKENMEISITLECYSFNSTESDEILYKIISNSKRVVFECSKEVDDGIAVSFVFDGFWVKV